MREYFYQWSLILLFVIVTAVTGIFVYREVFPEYKIYQNTYVTLEKFHADETHTTPADFTKEVKQIVMPHSDRDDLGPENIDRCVSCHVATQVPYFSPTKIAYDVNGEVMVDEHGKPVLIPNEEYVWKRVDDKIAALTDEKTNEQLKKDGKNKEVRERLAEAEYYKELKTAKVGDFEYDMTKVLRMHPLLGREKVPFQYHPLEEYGCTVCHNGNGRGLVTDRAHGPVYDGQYEESFQGPIPKFTETDPNNDPSFARVFNGKPGHRLLFQTTPLYPGHLMQAKCIQCHQLTNSELTGLSGNAQATNDKEKEVDAVKQGVKHDLQAITALLALKKDIQTKGYQQTVNTLQALLKGERLSPEEQKMTQARLAFLDKAASTDHALDAINRDLVYLLGSNHAVRMLEQGTEGQGDVAQFLEEQRPITSGALAAKERALNSQESPMIAGRQAPVTTEVDVLLGGYHHGQELFVSQACYACHKIAGFSRGGVGLELTKAGLAYPWFIKEAIVWPQSVPGSTMPNFKLDHEELEDIMTFLMGQRGPSNAVSDVDYKTRIKNWDAGKKMPWEQPLSPEKIHDVHGAMIIYASEGCASCHRLLGFDSSVGFAVEKGNASFDKRFAEQQWFRRLIPEEMLGSQIVDVLDAHGVDIDARIVPDVRQGAILEEIEVLHPGLIESFYTNFKYAERAKNHHYQELIAKDPQNRAKYEQELAQWKDRVHRVLMMYIQEYGLGRLVAPRINWSGVFRDDEWLMQHFRSPGSTTPKTIMPAISFDDSKFYALTHMINVLSRKNRDALREVWNQQGFDPEFAYEILCANCHGVFAMGDGPTAQWIYPIPKNLRNATFLRNMTKEREIFSITHGVWGTPMPRWGEVAAGKGTDKEDPILKPEEIKQLVDWLFLALPGGEVVTSANVPKWKYRPQDVVHELQQEGGSELKVEQVFEEVPPVREGPDEEFYFIKKQYYTPENLRAGEEFFVLNCAVCHGKDASGNGERAEAMTEAKPRMLTNLNWLRLRDDLRLLRSIKYGVPGTAMTPWGDLTTSKQRMQLVMFIRSLTEDAEQREDLSNALFVAFEDPIMSIEKMRASDYVTIEKLRELYEKARSQRVALYEQAEKGQPLSPDAVAAYQQELNALTTLKAHEERDRLLITLRDKVKKEQDIYRTLGLSFIDKKTIDDIVKAFIQLVKGNDGRFTFVDGRLKLNDSSSVDATLKNLEQHIAASLDGTVASLQKQRDLLAAKLSTPQVNHELSTIDDEIKGLKKAKANLFTGLDEAAELRKQEAALYQQYEQQGKNR